MSDSSKNDQPLKSIKLLENTSKTGHRIFGIPRSFQCLEHASLFINGVTDMTLDPNSTFENESDDSYIENDNQNTTLMKPAKHFNSAKYDWSEQTQGLIFSSFYWGYIITSVLGGVIVRKFGSKCTLGLGILFTSLFTILTPYCIYFGGSTALIVLRIAMGIGEGTTYPAVIDLLAHWIPENERSKAGSMVFGGSSTGTIFGTFMSGIILQHSENGWPMVFYFYGTVGVISFPLIWMFCYSRPSENPYISAEELTYLQNELNNMQSNPPATPRRYVLTSPAVWALFAVKFSNAWGYVTIISDMPKYMNSVLHVSAQDNGYLSSIPHLAKWIFTFLASRIADKVIAEKILSITMVRKIGCTIASLGPAIFLVAGTYAGSDGFLAIVLQSIGLVFMGCSYCCVLVNALDLSPNYASSIMGLGNGVAVTAGALSPYIAGVITPNQTISEWRMVFWIVFAIFATSNLVYLIYGSGEVQEWNDPAYLDKKKVGNIERVEAGVELLPLNGP